MNDAIAADAFHRAWRAVQNGIVHQQGAGAHHSKAYARGLRREHQRRRCWWRRQHEGSRPTRIRRFYRRVAQMLGPPRMKPA